MKRILLLLPAVILLCNAVSQAQVTKIRGTITDKDTKEPVPFATVAFKGTTLGAIGDFDGVYFLETKEKVNTIIVSCLGYIADTIVIKQNEFQEIDIELAPESFDIDEVTVHAGVNPANILMKKVIKNRKKNNPERFTSYSYEQYNKMELDVNNFDENIKYVKKLEKYKFIFDNIDNEVSNGKNFLPIMMSETLSDFYYQNQPHKEKEVIKAVNLSGVENKSVMQFTGQMYLDINLYDNYIYIIEKQFVSPVAINGLLVYEYYLTDSMFIDNKWCYQLTYKPRRKFEYTFQGDMWIADTTFAVKKINANISKDVNIDFVKSMYFTQEYEMVDDSIFFPAKETIFVDFNIADFTTGFFGRKNTSRKNIKVNIDFDEKFFSKTAPQEVEFLDDAENKDSTYWNNSRHEELTKKEQQIYGMVDAVKEIPAFRTVSDIVMMLTLGYYDFGMIEYGPYFKTYSYNELEGHRFRMGGRTSMAFSKKVEFSGHLAYGTLDQKFKYGTGFKYKIKNQPWTVFNASYLHDMTQLGASPNAFTEDNIVSTMISTGVNNDLLLRDKLTVGIEKEWFKGLVNEVMINHKKIYPSQFISFTDRNNNVVSSLPTTEISINTHLSYNEKYMEGSLTRISFSSIYPIFDISYSFSPEGIFNTLYPYQKLTINMSHDIYMGPLGYLNYSAEAGKIFGKVPFPLLKLHEGNETYVFDPYSFNLMNYYEFASDEYLSFYGEQHFQGLFLNKIPMIRKLKMREVVYAKGVVGSLKEENRDEFQFPTSLSDVRKPYIEAGVGIENIFTFFRLDAIWRVTHTNKPDVAKFGLRASIQVQF